MAKRKTVKRDEVEINLAGSASAAVGDTELGQIRSLLFGQQAEETLQRVDNVEREIMTALGELADSVDARFREVDERFAAELDARLAGDSELQGRIDGQSKDVKKAQIDLRTKIERNAEEFTEQLGAARQELQGHIDTVDSDRRAETVDRQVLAGVFEQVANRLNSMDH